MSMTTKKIAPSQAAKQERKPLSPNTQKTIIISVICAVMIAVLIVSLVLVLKKPETTPEKPSSGNTSSSLYIKNGDFAYFSKEATSFPKTADNWTKFTYKAPESDKQSFTPIENEERVLMGVVDTSDEEWATVIADLANKGISGVTNPGIHDDDLDTNIYMLATKEATTACIMSQNFSVSPQASAKITIWLNTAQLKGGKVAISIHKYSYSSTPSADAADRYAYNFEIEATENNEWVAYELYVFNRQSGSTSVQCTVGIGNCYTGDAAEGVVFVDDISFETVSANEYRKFVANESNSTNYAIIGEDEADSADKYSSLVFFDNPDQSASVITLDDYLALESAQIAGVEYSPFTNNDKFNLYTITNDGTNLGTNALILNEWNNKPIVVSSSEELKDHLHISFWLRVAQNNVTAQGNVFVQTLTSANTWENLSSGSFTSIVTEQDISEDNNCGWTKYDIYLKPTSAAATTIRVLFVLGNEKGYTSTKYAPNGTLFITAPYIETISSSTYDSASSGSYSKKLSLVGYTASTTVSNGSFSTLVTSNPVQPTSWTPVFAGYNLIYKDGKGNDQIEGLPTGQKSAEGIVEKNNINGNAPAFDDSEQNVLRLTNNQATCFGYISADISLSARNVYAFSVLAKSEGSAVPYIYIVKNGAETRADAVIGKMVGKTDTTGLTSADDIAFGMIDSSEEAGGWTRYYIIIITGTSSETVRVALFNGSIDGATPQQGTVYFDYVSMNTVGSYSIDSNKYEEGDKDAPATDRDRIKFTTATGYSVFEDLTSDEITAIAAHHNVSVFQPDWDSMIEAALAEEPEETPEETPEKSSVDLGLLFSVISSVALVGSLLIVVVVRSFKKRGQQA